MTYFSKNIEKQTVTSLLDKYLTHLMYIFYTKSKWDADIKSVPDIMAFNQNIKAKIQRQIKNDHKINKA